MLYVKRKKRVSCAAFFCVKWMETEKGHNSKLANRQRENHAVCKYIDSETTNQNAM